MTRNRKLGNSFESELCKWLYQKGFWAHNFVQSKDGQPADVIAVKNQKAYLIDCKVCSDDYFKFSRMEENQINSMCLWEECGNGKGLFAISIHNHIFMLTKDQCLSLLKEKKQVGFFTLKENYKTIDEWLSEIL